MARRLVQEFAASKDDRSAAAEARMKKKADELHATGMPYQMAMAVAHGKLSLSDALERMARTDKVNALIKRHDISRALATQIAMGHADLERVLARQRFEAHRAEFRDFSMLERAAESGEPMTLDLHDRRRLTGTIDTLTPYSFVLHPEEGDSEEIHKLQAMAAWRPDDWKRVRKIMRTEKGRAGEPKGPVVKPQDRYPCSDRRLFRCLDENIPVTMTLLEGLQLAGFIRWISRYELGLNIKGDAEVIIFRHALDHLREG